MRAYGDMLTAPASRSDWWSALLLCAALLPLYLLTMYPDVLASGDSAKFQYIGPVLGTPHPPGYPLYMLVSYAWSWLPLGTLAWRMNLLSIVAALLAVACVYFAGRRLGAGPAHAALVAAALGVGRIFWEKSLAAEVYSIGAALVAAALWRVLVWRDTRQTRDLLIPVALLAAGLGNHLTIAMVAPAFVAFALAVDARSVLRWRVVGGGLLLVLAGLSQYGYILWRTSSRSPYLEASARTLGELGDVMRASRYENDMFARGWRELLGAPLESLGSLLFTELGIAGVVVVAAGTVLDLRHAWRETVLLVGSALAVLLLALNIEADTAGFIMPALPPLWLLAAVALARSTASWRSWLSTVCAAVLVVGVAMAGRTNFRSVDHSDRTIERRMWSGVLEVVPDGTRVVSHSYLQDQSLLYLLHGERVSSRDITLLHAGLPDIDRAFRDERRTVVAFEPQVRQLQPSGLEFEPLPVLDAPIPELVGASRRDRFVIAAVQPEATPALVADAPTWLESLGASWRPDSRPARYVMVGLARGGRDAAEILGEHNARLSVPAGTAIDGVELPVPVEVEASPGVVRIAVDGEEILKTPGPMAVVVLAEGGQVRRRLVPATPASLRPPLDTLVFRLVRSVRCADIGDRRWHDATDIADRQIRVRFDNYRDHPARATVYVGGAAAFEISTVEVAGTRAPEVIHASVSASERLQQFERDGFVASEKLRDAPYLVRLDVRVDDPVDIAVLTLDLGSTPAVMAATGSADRIAGPRVRVCR
jgi:hypothetical protein